MITLAKTISFDLDSILSLLTEVGAGLASAVGLLLVFLIFVCIAEPRRRRRRRDASRGPGGASDESS